ncbi:metallophosphoesterase [Mesopusillimonas faecipullorum]|uniref:metallophosphoesterase n=1 Tax=Mesopusillimonas faecipullorum TaxID=2755040 RepID=UPI0028F3EB16|nr:metallophosphoesterase [Mesopusillimonas faecipullorum]
MSSLLALYVAWRVVFLQRWRSGTKWGVAVVLVLISQHHLVTRNFFGSMASPEIPAVGLMLLGWAYSAVLLTAAFVFFLDLCGLLAVLCSKRVGRCVLGAPGPRAGMGLCAMLLAALGVWQAVKVPEVRDIEIEVAHLPAELDGFQLIQLTDLHASRLLPRTWMQAVVERTNALDADMIVITGDLLDGTVAARTNDVEPLKSLAARHPVYAVVGNHEYYAEHQQWLDHFKRLGIRILSNEHVTIRHNDAEFTLAGVTDPAAAPLSQPMPDIVAALAGVPADSAVILLSHRPGGALKNAGAGADLQLSGHTHGGQILVLHWLTQWANEGFVSGRYDVEGMALYVSNGSGLWPGFPIRLGKPSEISRITLRSAARQR